MSEVKRRRSNYVYINVYIYIKIYINVDVNVNESLLKNIIGCIIQ